MEMLELFAMASFLLVQYNRPRSLKLRMWNSALLEHAMQRFIAIHKRNLHLLSNPLFYEQHPQIASVHFKYIENRKWITDVPQFII